MRHLDILEKCRDESAATSLLRVGRDERDGSRPREPIAWRVQLWGRPSGISATSSAPGRPSGSADGQLLARYSGSKDEVAFEALVARHGPMVLATCRAVLKNEHDVEDAFQTTFLVLAKKARSIRGGDALGGWLHRVAYRAGVQASVEAKQRRRKEAEASAMAPLECVTSRVRDRPRLRPILHEEIDRLPEGQRLPVVLCDLEGLTYEQAAEQLRWTVPTLRCRLAKARQRLKGRLTRRGFAAPAVGARLAAKGASAASRRRCSGRRCSRRPAARPRPARRS